LTLARFAGRGYPCPIAGRSRMPSWHPLAQTGPRFGILPSLGRSSRLLGHGQPRPIRWFSRIVWGARIKWAPYKYLNRGGVNSGIEFAYAVPTRLSAFIITSCCTWPTGRWLRCRRFAAAPQERLPGHVGRLRLVESCVWSLSCSWPLICYSAELRSRLRKTCIPMLRGIRVGRMSISPVFIFPVMGTTTAITTLSMASTQPMATAIMSRGAITPQPEPRFMSQAAIMITMPSISMT